MQKPDVFLSPPNSPTELILNKQKVQIADGFIISSYSITANEAKLKHYLAALCN